MTRAWSSHDDAVLRECLTAGGDWRATAARRCDRTEAAVYLRASRLVRRGEIERALLENRGRRRGWLHWSNLERATVRQMAARGDSAAQIAARLGRSVHAVHTWCSHNGVRLKRPGGGGSKPWSAADDAYLVTVRDEGLAIEGVAEELGRTPTAVRIRLSRLRPRGVWRWSTEDDARLRRLHALGRSDRQIAVALGRGEDGVGHRRRFLGLVRATVRGVDGRFGGEG